MFKNSTLRPIIKGFLWGIIIPIVVLGLFLLEGSLELVGFGMIFIFMALLILSGFIFLVLFLRGVIISYKKSKNPWVFLSVIVPILVAIAVIFLYSATSSPIIGY